MIKLQNMTPDPYYRQSRDFQFLGRLFDLVLNYVKTNVDQIYNLPLSYKSDPQLIDLMASTLGFKHRHNYTAEQLFAVCMSFCEILRNKGSKKGIELAASAVLNAEGIEQSSKCEIQGDTVIVYLPQSIGDVSLFRDILLYILPAGMKCEIVRTYMYMVDGGLSTTKAGTKEYVRYMKDFLPDANVAKYGEDTFLNKARSITRKNSEGEIEETIIGEIKQENYDSSNGFFKDARVFRPKKETE